MKSECLIMSYFLSYEVLYFRKDSTDEHAARFDTREAAERFIIKHLNEWARHTLVIKAGWDGLF